MQIVIGAMIEERKGLGRERLVIVRIGKNLALEETVERQ
jgi:hypothetical protein